MAVSDFYPRATDSRSPVDGWRIRPVRTEDLVATATVITESFHPGEGWLAWLSTLLRLGIYQDLRHRVLAANYHYACFVVSLESTPQTAAAILGTVEVALRPIDSYGFRCAYISNLAILPNYRRQGMARQLLVACEQTVLDWGIRDLYLHVLEHNQAARRLYTQSGYRLQQADPLWLGLFTGRWCWRDCSLSRRLLLHKRLTG